MSTVKLHIKNMVCQRCKMVVQTELEKLHLHPIAVDLGEITLAENRLNDGQLTAVKNALEGVGFELLDDRKSRTIEKIKSVLINAIHHSNEELNKESENKEYDLAAYHFNPKLRELSHAGKTQTLSPKENELLKMLCEHLNDLLPREQALKRIWGSDTYFNGRSMDVYIAKLRKYLKEDPNIEIVNIHGNGFRLVVQNVTA